MRPSEEALEAQRDALMWLMEKRGMTHKELATVFGVSSSTMSKWASMKTLMSMDRWRWIDRVWPEERILTKALPWLDVAGR